jgi:anti-anti-sigma regulatory factor
LLRITIQNDQGVTQFILEGKLAGACVCELEKCWQNSIVKQSPAQVVIDLTNVTYVDNSGRELLSQMFQEGTRFTARLLMPKSIIQEIECGSEPSQPEAKRP